MLCFVNYIFKKIYYSLKSSKKLTFETAFQQ
jgi:hypothetical protein